MNWAALEAISTTITAAFALFTARIVITQILEMRRATHATAFKAVYDMMQADDIRAARGLVMGALSQKPLSQWTRDERDTAEKVCQNYDAVGIMCKRGFIPTEVVADSWGGLLAQNLADTGAASHGISHCAKFGRILG